MNALTRAGYAFGFAALLPFAPAGAQGPLALDAGPSVSRIADDPGIIASRWERAEQLRSEGALDAALNEYEAVAQLQIEDNVNPSKTYWAMAEIHNAKGDTGRMTRAMDQVITHARRFGDYDLRARALLESAAGYSALRNYSRAEMRVAELRRMMDQGEISEELQAFIGRRLQG